MPVSRRRARQKPVESPEPESESELSLHEELSEPADEQEAENAEEEEEEVEEEEAEGEEQERPSVQFNKSLKWTPGRPIAEGELLKRLKAFFNEVEDLEPEDIDVQSLRGTAEELVHDRLLSHRNRGVQAWAVRCVVEVMRIFAPDAPYSAKQLQVR